MIKKAGCLLFVLIMLLSMCVFNANAVEPQGKTIKKIVSIVYDDSGSMKNKNEDWAYASYSLQNMMGLMGSQDELSVVRMSSPEETVSFDLSTNKSRKEAIKNVEGWAANGLTTPFEAVDTAVEWLRAKKSEYADSQAVEFWLVIITDGVFESGYPKNMSKYLANLKDSMVNSKFEGICVAIGGKVPQSIKNDWKSATGNHLITASNSEDIVNAMSEVSGLIMGQGGKCTDVNITPIVGSKGITFTSAFPLKKFIVYEQNQSVGITSIKVDGATVKTTSDFTAKKPGKGKINSRTIHCEAGGADYIPAGQITINFDSKINTSENNFKILTDSAVNVDFKVLDKAGNEIKDLEKASLVEGDIVEFAATVTSCIDKTPINLKRWIDELSAELIVNDQSVPMEYNPIDNTFYGDFKIKSGSNLAYSIITLPGYFRTKSDVVNIYPIEVIENPSYSVSDATLDVTYKHCSEYEEVGAFTYTLKGGTINGICNFEFKNMPKGITVSVNGIYADENGKLSAKIRNNIPADIKVYRNKDYKETEQSTISINVTSNQYVLEWEKGSATEIKLNPVKRNIKVETSQIQNEGGLKLYDFDGKAIYNVSVLADGEYLTAEELDSLKVELSEIGGILLKTEVVEYNGKYALRVVCERTSPELFVKTGDVSSNLTVTTAYNEKSEPTVISFSIEDNILKFVFPIVLIIIIVVLIGYLPGVKKRLPVKKYHIQANGEDEAIYIKASTRWLPYVAQKGSGSDLSLVATSNKNKVLVVLDLYSEQKVLLNDDPKDETKIYLGVGDELKITESNRETVYKYCNSADSDSPFDNDDDFGGFGGFDDTDDMFGDDTATSAFGDNSSDDFFS